MAVHRAPKTPGKQRPPVKSGKLGDLPVRQAMKAGDSQLTKTAPPAEPEPQGGAGS